MIRTLAFLFLLLPVGAVAQDVQDVTFSPETTEICLASTETQQASRNCIGEAATQCMEATEGGFSTAGMGGCLDRELAYWDGVLNTEYQTMVRRAREFDAHNDGGPVSVAQNLRDAQRAWITFRDKTCTYEMSLWGGGTGQGPALAGCLMRMTAEQALYLRYIGIEG